MHVRKHPTAAVALACMALALSASAASKEKPAPGKKTEASGPALLWTEPGNLESRDLFYGPGGQKDAPAGPFTFVKEDLDGSNPKFEIKDSNGVKWKAKLGNEAQPETAATRIVWAVGYYATEDYLVPDLQVNGMPARLKRGWKLVGLNGTMHNVRLKKEPGHNEKKIGEWRWRSNAFTGTRELNGLRTLMAVINNWDLKDVNNAIYQDRDHDQRIFLVSDLGATFSCAGRCWPRARTKGDLEKYRQSKFIRKTGEDTVSFACPARPTFEYLVGPREYWGRVRLEWIGKNVPRADAKWMGGLLSRLSSRQIHDAFRAAGYSGQDLDGFSEVLEQRIAALRDL
jgi:hypothetical protein